jgi:hypothetical protein
VGLLKKVRGSVRDVAGGRCDHWAMTHFSPLKPFCRQQL